MDFPENYDGRLSYIQAYTLHLQQNDCIQSAVSGLWCHIIWLRETNILKSDATSIF